MSSAVPLSFLKDIISSADIVVRAAQQDVGTAPIVENRGRSRLRARLIRLSNGLLELSLNIFSFCEVGLDVLFCVGQVSFKSLVRHFRHQLGINFA